MPTFIYTPFLHRHDAPIEAAVPARDVLPPACCMAAFEVERARDAADAERRQDDAVHGERRRIVTESITAIRAYADAALSVLPDRAARDLLVTVADRAVIAVQKTGCICPDINVGTFGNPDRTMRGFEPLCGLHDRDDNPKEA
jgi:hypothetical protein